MYINVYVCVSPIVPRWNLSASPKLLTATKGQESIVPSVTRLVLDTSWPTPSTNPNGICVFRVGLFVYSKKWLMQ